MTKDSLQIVLEKELAEARQKADETRQKADEAAQELQRVELTYKTYMEKEAQSKRSIFVKPAVFRQQSITMYDRIMQAVDDFDKFKSFNARAVFDALGRDDAKYESTRPTITTTLRQLEHEGRLKKVGHGVYQKKK
jgi:hypothetical protein